MSINNNGVYSLSRDAQDIIAGLKSKLKRTETELAKCRDLMNHANSDARQMAAQLDGIEDTIRFVTKRAERLHSEDPTDPVRAGRAAALREFLYSVETITGRTA